ncbi:oxygen-insensitive NAD(P)H nitroreductase [Pseudoalteromonas sp. CO348]|uniref:oxygen-insensitive NAD(P)H nitroreductase n=1 Tax=Pseudoalteromonas sp. CO348 TaxID=1777271 RepID=UPI001022CAED|nr:oxygen-insensitive NAD(P)H nitroreductase [Pseudoalteromonas sp. CO348]RZG08233.1 oxygen-insensitive NAD(P)H nitroreductase [Pseudoalteromonas sp. CO348]
MYTLRDAIHNRYSTKAFDPNKKISDSDIDLLKQALRLSPSSTNVQPWHFVIASTEAGKTQVAKSTQENYKFNEAKILNASHVVVFAAKQNIDDAHLDKVLAKESADGRFEKGSEIEAQMNNGRRYFVGLNQTSDEAIKAWTGKQVYLNLGQFLLGAASLGIDSVPIEGFDAEILSNELGLTEQGFDALAIVALGYRDEGDFNAKLPKSRLAIDDIITEI